MATGEFEIVQIKQEVDCNHFNEVAQTDTVKYVPEVNVFSRCGMYDESKLNPEYIDHSEVCEDISTDKCNVEQIKNENNIDIFYEDIKREIYEEKSSELSKFCEVCYKSFSSETEVTDSKNNWLQCRCQNQNESINLQGDDVKPSSLILSTDFGFLPSLKNDKRPNNIDDLNFPKRECSSVSESNVFEKPQMTKISELKVPETIHTEEKSFQCKICSKTFSKLRYLQGHKKLHTEKKIYHCKICFNTFNKLTHLKAHKSIHKDKKTLHCKICSKTFIMNSKNLKAHERMHAKAKQFPCNVCSKYFISLNILKDHQERVHTGEKHFYCKICLKTFFMNSSNFKVHEMIHTREKPLYCKICLKYFGSLKMIKEHERMHAEEKPFYCKICLKTFIMSSSNFKIHERIHTGEKPYHCKICSRTFSSFHYVKIHERVHTGENQFHQLNLESS